MQHVHALRKLKFDLLTPSPGMEGAYVHPGGETQAFDKNSCLNYYFIFIVPLSACEISVKNYYQVRKGGGGGVIQ